MYSNDQTHTNISDSRLVYELQLERERGEECMYEFVCVCVRERERGLGRMASRQLLTHAQRYKVELILGTFLLPYPK